jgi:hydrogenase/urease accessory protein HupE
VRRALLLPVALGALMSGGAARAHEVRPGYLELRETSPGLYRVLWKQPRLGDLRLRIDPVFPKECTVRAGAEALTPGALLLRGTLECSGGLAGKTLAVSGLEATITDVLVRVQHADGRSETSLLRPGTPTVTLGKASRPTQRAVAYLWLGVEHILLGVDHLLFVLGLLLIVSDRLVLVKTITSFTVAHSITLAIATFGYASAPLPPLNAAIALSLLFLGPEIVRVWRGGTSLTIRHPWLVAFAFGLLHGFGLASGLAAMGLPRGEVPVALFLFNVGVEMGQLAFLFLILALQSSFRALEIRWPRFVQALPGYAVGSLGAYWTIQRTVLLFEGTR